MPACNSCKCPPFSLSWHHSSLGQGKQHLWIDLQASAQRWASATATWTSMRRCCCITGGRSSAAACSMPWPVFLPCEGVRVCVAQGKFCCAALLPLGHCGCQSDCRKMVKFKGSSAASLAAGAAQPPAVCNDQPSQQVESLEPRQLGILCWPIQYSQLQRVRER